MKKLIVISIFFLFTYNITFSQVNVNTVNINELDIRYCSIVGYNASLFGNRIIVTVDYGQKYHFWKAQIIKNSEGKNMIFHSMIDALNFMESNGWEYINNTEYTNGNANVSNFLLRKKE